MMSLFHDTSFWVLLAFSAFVILAWKKVSAGLKKGLDQRIATVTRQLDEARKLRDEAQALFEEYDRQRQEADKNARDIIDNARLQAEQIRAHAREAAERIVARHTAVVDEHIRQAEIQAVADVRREASEITMNMVRTLLAEHMDEQVRRTLVSQSIDSLATTTLN